MPVYTRPAQGPPRSSTQFPWLFVYVTQRWPLSSTATPTSENDDALASTHFSRKVPSASTWPSSTTCCAPESLFSGRTRARRMGLLPVVAARGELLIAAG